MKEVTRYQAEDGTVFSTPEAAEKYETSIAKLYEIMKPLGDKPKDDECKFANGHGYIPHDVNVINDVRKAFHEYATNWLNQRSIEHINSPNWHGYGKSKEEALEEAKNTTYEPHFIGRYLDDSGSPLYTAWLRLYCIDEQGREWGQPYFALNPGKGDQFVYHE